MVTPLLAISIKEAVKLNHLVHLRYLEQNIFIWAFTWMLLTVIFSAITGIISDHYCRKTVLTITLSFSIVSLILMLLKQYKLSLIVDGIFCAVTPVARAAYCEIRQHVTKHRMLAETIMVQAITWIILTISPIVFLNYATIISLISFIFPLVLTTFFFKDVRDSDIRIPLHIFKDSLSQYLGGWPIRLLIAFFLFNLAFQLPNYYSAVFLSKGDMQFILLVVEGSGIFLGSLCTWIFQFPANYRSLLLTSCMLFFTFLIDLFFSSIFGFSQVSLITLFIFSLIGGVVLTLIFVYFSSLVKPHEEGLLYGILEGNQILAEVLITPVIYVLYKFVTREPILMLKDEYFLIMLGIGICFILAKGKKPKTII